jgi:hypothetical protein
MPGMFVVAPIHTPPAWQIEPAQQAVPTVPQLKHVRVPVAGFAHARPLVHVLPVQHGWLVPPHGEQIPSDAPPAPWHE